MIKVPAYNDKTIAVYGLARTGAALVRSLVASGANVFAGDDRLDHVEGADIPVQDLMGLDFRKIDALALSPGVPLTHPVQHPLVKKAKEADIPIIGDIEVFEAARPDLPLHHVVAITGTNGKSTTTALLTHVLKEVGHPAALGGNIGVPVMSLDSLPEGGAYVLELSSFQIDLTHHFTPDVAILLNITPDHLDRHGSLSGYVSAKRRLFDMQRVDQLAIISVDDPHGMAIASTLHQRVIPFSVQQELSYGLYVRDGQLVDATGELPEVVGDISDFLALRGRHNQQNIMAVYGAAKALGLKENEILSGFQSFPGLKHRLQPVAEKAGVLFINDSKASNTDAASKALQAVGDNIYWIAGGRFKEDSLNSLMDSLSGVRCAYLIGESAPLFQQALKSKIPVKVCHTLEVAAETAAKDAWAAEGGTVLLAPASASFDQYESFEHRGDDFVRVAENLTGGAS